MNPICDRLARIVKPVIGMVHLLPLPLSPRYGGNLDDIRNAMLDDARALADGGVHALMIENFGDVPFHGGQVPPAVVAHMAALATDLRRAVDLPLGINVLRNDGLAAMSVAHAAGADFVRVNVLAGARLADQGILQSIAADLLRLRAQLGAQHIRILADVQVKHSAALAERPLADEIDDTLTRGLADGIIISGSGTGRPADLRLLLQARRAVAGRAAVLVGRGVTPRTMARYARHADGFIVGTALKRDGDARQRVDARRVRSMMQAWRACCAESAGT